MFICLRFHVYLLQVPRIFIDGKCIGGSSDLTSLNESGGLRDLLKDL